MLHSNEAAAIFNKLLTSSVTSRPRSSSTFGAEQIVRKKLCKITCVRIGMCRYAEEFPSTTLADPKAHLLNSSCQKEKSFKNIFANNL